MTANYGGRLVFEHAAAIPTPVLQEELHERSEGHHHHGGDEESPATPATPLTPKLRPTWTRRALRLTPTRIHPALRRTRTRCAGRLLSLALILGAACQPNTGRPVFSPLPEAAGTEVRLTPAEATRQLAAALRADSVPVTQGPGSGCLSGNRLV